MASLSSTKPIRFSDVKPGSRIEVTDANNAYEPFEADVLEMKAEYGPSRIPALVLKAAHNPSSLLITANGQTRVKVLLDSGVLATDGLPTGAVRARSIPVDVEAVQFAGGSGSGMTIIRFGGGLASMRLETATDQQTEAIIIARGGDELRVEIGDWVLRGGGKIWPEKPDTFATNYEVL